MILVQTISTVFIEVQSPIQDSSKLQGRLNNQPEAKTRKESEFQSGQQKIQQSGLHHLHNYAQNI